MNVTVFVLTCVGSVATIITLLIFASQNSLSNRERAIAAAKEPLEREINDLRNEVKQLRDENRDVKRRCQELEDELRRRR